jgi:hypothetical protein
MLDYVDTATVIRRLNDATDNKWSFEMTKSEIVGWGQGQLLIVYGALHIPDLGSRAGTGVQLLNVQAGEDTIKGALSDCLKKCATLFGVGLELYGPDLEAGELPTPRQQYPSGAPQSTQTSAWPNAGTQPFEPDPNAATPKQQGFLMGQARKNGWTEGELHEYLKQMYGVESVKLLTKTEASAVIDYVQNGNLPPALVPQSLE